MPPSTTSLFPDINVWVALTYEGHVHHAPAAAWFAELQPDEALAFCRLTQLGLLRLLTTAAVMGDEVMTQPQAWTAYDRWLQDPRVRGVDEPSGIEPRFRSLTRRRQPATKDWADSFLAAFATAGGLTLVTFDGALRARAKSAILLRPVADASASTRNPGEPTEDRRITPLLESTSCGNRPVRRADASS